jgi:hypothetical protein
LLLKKPTKNFNFFFPKPFLLDSSFFAVLLLFFFVFQSASRVPLWVVFEVKRVKLRAAGSHIMDRSSIHQNLTPANKKKIQQLLQAANSNTGLIAPSTTTDSLQTIPTETETDTKSLPDNKLVLHPSSSAVQENQHLPNVSHHTTVTSSVGDTTTPSSHGSALSNPNKDLKRVESTSGFDFDLNEDEDDEEDGENTAEPSKESKEVKLDEKESIQPVSSSLPSTSSQPNSTQVSSSTEQSSENTASGEVKASSNTAQAPSNAKQTSTAKAC